MTQIPGGRRVPKGKELNLVGSTRVGRPELVGVDFGKACWIVGAVNGGGPDCEGSMLAGGRPGGTSPRRSEWR